MMDKINEAVDFIRQRTSLVPAVGVILGSGLGSLADDIDADAVIPYGEIPHCRASNVVGHSGRMVLGRFEGLPVVMLQGRIHFYEGYAMEEVVFLTRVIARLGAKRVIVTNAAGGMNEAFGTGDLMLISDHINFFGENPLRGKNLDGLGPRFPDLSEAYPREFRETAHRVADRLGMSLHEGVYVGLSGPTYETPAEIRAYRMLGGDAVGMSTIPEVITLVHMGIPVLGISCVTNMAAGMGAKLDHSEVMEVTVRVRDKFVSLVKGILSELSS